MAVAQLLRRASPVLQAAANDDESNLALLIRLATSQLIKPPPAPQPLPQLNPRRYPMDERMPDGRSVTEAVGGLSAPGFGAPRNDSMEVRTGQLEEMAPPALDERGPLPAAVPALTASLDPQTPQDPPPAPQLETRPRRVIPVAETIEPPSPLLSPRRPLRTQNILSDQEPQLVPPGNEPFGSSGEPFEITRPRRTQPRDYVADDEAYLRDLRNAPVERSRLKSFGLAALRGLANGPGGAIGGGLVGALDPELYGRSKRNREIQRAEENLGQGLQTQKGGLDREYRRAQTDALRRRPDVEAGKAETQRRQTLATLYNRLPEFDPEDPAYAGMVSALEAAGLPVVPKSRAQQLRFVQDARTGQWTIISGDRATGQGTAQSVTTSEGTSAITTPTAQMSAENQAANRASRERLAGAGIASREKIAAQNRQSRETVAELKRRAGSSGGVAERGRLTGAANEISKLENLKTEAADPTNKSAAASLEKAITQAAKIRQVYGDLVEVGHTRDSEGRVWSYAKLKQGGQLSPHRNAQPVRAGGLTEQRVREHARQKGLDPDELVRRARAEGDIP